MALNYIHAMAQELVDRFSTRDPFVIAEALGAHIKFVDNFVNLKGMYRVILGQRYIFLSSHLDERTRRIVCAHELGHDQLHRPLATDSIMREFMLYDMNSRPEYEANLFAAALLLDDQSVSECASDGCDVVQTAMRLETDVNLVLIKIAQMNERGYHFNPPERSDTTFLKN